MNKNAELPINFTARHGTPDDIPTAVELFNRFSQHYLGVRDVEVDDVKNEWTMPGFNPKTDTRLVFSPDGNLVGYVEVWLNETPLVHPWVWGRVDPDFERQGIGTYLMAWAEERAREALSQSPPDLRVAYRTGCYNAVEPCARLMQSLDLPLIRHSFRMRIELDSAPPEPVWPDGISVRTPEDVYSKIEALYQVDDEVFQDHFGYVPQPYEDGLARFRHHFAENEAYNDPSLWFMAMDGDEIVGICLCRKYGYEDKQGGYISSLGVRRPWRKRGIGLALLQHAFGEYYRRGYHSVSLGVDAENLTGALRLYEKAGMHVHRQFDLYEKELRPGKEISVESLG